MGNHPSSNMAMAATSLTMSTGHARLNELTARMNSVHDDFENEKKARSSVMELKCRAIDEKIMRNKRSEDERLKPLYILIERLGLDIGHERDQLQILDSKLNNDIKDLEARMAVEIDEQRKQRKELETKIIKQIDQACVNLREDFAREKERRDESQKRREKKVADEILRITESLDQERKNRLSGENGIYTKMNERLRDVENALLEEREGDEEALIKKLLGDINEVHNSIKQEGTIRAESETHIVRVLEDMCQKLHAEIQAERKDRQSTEQVFMKLLDETCESIALRASSKTLAELTKKIGS